MTAIPATWVHKGLNGLSGPELLQCVFLHEPAMRPERLNKALKSLKGSIKVLRGHMKELKGLIRH